MEWGLLPPNEFGRIAQNVRKGEVEKEGKTGILGVELGEIVGQNLVDNFLSKINFNESRGKN